MFERQAPTGAREHWFVRSACTFRALFVHEKKTHSTHNINRFWMACKQSWWGETPKSLADCLCSVRALLKLSERDERIRWDFENRTISDDDVSWRHNISLCIDSYSRTRSFLTSHIWSLSFKFCCYSALCWPLVQAIQMCFTCALENVNQQRGQRVFELANKLAEVLKQHYWLGKFRKKRHSKKSLLTNYRIEPESNNIMNCVTQSCSLVFLILSQPCENETSLATPFIFAMPVIFSPLL